MKANNNSNNRDNDNILINQLPKTHKVMKKKVKKWQQNNNYK